MGRKSQIAFLETVFPPFTNRNVKILTDKANENVAQILRRSNFYMIAARPETKFVNYAIVEGSGKFKVDIQIGGTIVDSGVIDVSKLEYINKVEHPIVVTTEQAILIDTTKKGTHAKVWLTPDSVYWNAARGEPYISGFQNHREVCNYDLLYVGIATEQDSYARLIKKAHHARQRILSEEPQRNPGAHLSDEIILFLYDIEPFAIQTISADDDDDFDFFHGAEKQKIVKDAEKAFVKLLDPYYNSVKFKAYPLGKDGLYGEGIDSYSYAICENFIFNTPSARFKGKYSEQSFDNEQDFINVEGDEVKVYFSGVDFDLDGQVIETSLEEATDDAL